MNRTDPSKRMSPDQTAERTATPGRLVIVTHSARAADGRLLTWSGLAVEPAQTIVRSQTRPAGRTRASSTERRRRHAA